MVKGKPEFGTREKRESASPSRHIRNAEFGARGLGRTNKLTGEFRIPKNMFGGGKTISTKIKRSRIRLLQRPLYCKNPSNNIGDSLGEAVISGQDKRLRRLLTFEGFRD